MDGETFYICWKALDTLELKCLDKMADGLGDEDYTVYFSAKLNQAVGIATAKMELDKLCKIETGKSAKEWC